MTLPRSGRPVAAAGARAGRDRGAGGRVLHVLRRDRRRAAGLDRRARARRHPAAVDLGADPQRGPAAAAALGQRWSTSRPRSSSPTPSCRACRPTSSGCAGCGRSAAGCASGSRCGASPASRSSIELRLAVGNDFADLFEIKDVVRDRSAQIIREPRGRRVGAGRSAYRNGEFAARTRVEVSPPATRVDGDDLVWELDLADDATWSVEITVPFDIGPNEVVPVRSRLRRGRRAVPADDATARWFAEVPDAAVATPTCCAASASRPRGTCWRCGCETRLDGHRRDAARGRPAVVPDRLRAGHAHHGVPVRLLWTAAGPRRAAASWPRCRARRTTTSRTRSRARSCTRSGRAS